MTLQFGASLTDDTRSVNYDHNTFKIQAPGSFPFQNFKIQEISDQGETSQKLEKSRLFVRWEIELIIHRHLQIFSHKYFFWLKIEIN